MTDDAIIRAIASNLGLRVSGNSLDWIIWRHEANFTAQVWLTVRDGFLVVASWNGNTIQYELADPEAFQQALADISERTKFEELRL